MKPPTAFLRPAAAKEIDEIGLYIEQDNPKAAARFYLQVGRALDLLAQFPEIGTFHAVRHARLSALRSWPISGFNNYLIFYLSLESAGVDVLHVLHGKRDVDRIIESD